ncbi:hypothetical protein CHS0354_003239 [Potamilus streckersoni]|uniref:Leucine-rich repeat-containing protein 14 n=1 Tax=Potamilus streckersoni TaxID=2493646 RepID=A0AAE0RYP0_9BIVA|nr:hypothetical protein CHS0354_003239 [Potamilus streckersoni]
MNDCMDDVNYKTKDFSGFEISPSHPMWMTDTHFIYHMHRNDEGEVLWSKDEIGRHICSPRRLSEICMRFLVSNPIHIARLRLGDVPSDLYPALLTESIFNRELHSVQYLISTWPLPVLDVRNVLPLEDNITYNYLTQPLEGEESLSLTDVFMYGLLCLKKESRLKLINFCGFKNDRKLCRELSRLPFLWYHVEERKSRHFHSILSKHLNISVEKIQKYINKICCIFSNLDPYIPHGEQFGPVTVVFECKVTLEDVPIGLALQYETPFRFACQKVWFEPISEVIMPFTNIGNVVRLRDITHLQITDPLLCTEVKKFNDLLEGLLLLPNLTSLSLPNTIHINVYPNAAHELSQTIRHLPRLQKLNLSACNLKECLDMLLTDLNQHIHFLNLCDCRLSKNDIQFLLQWENLKFLQELNLSRNDLKNLAYLCVDILHQMPDIVCFGISYTSLSDVGLRQIIKKCIECSKLKMITIQTFTPLPIQDIYILLNECAQIASLQKCMFFPDGYAFPGINEAERVQNRHIMLELCLQCLEQLGRSDICLE